MIQQFKKYFFSIKTLFFLLFFCCMSGSVGFTQTAQDYFKSGNQKFKQQKLAEALADYRKAIESDKNFGKAYHNLGNVQFVLQDYENALKNFNKAIEITPKDCEPYCSRGAMYYALKKYKDALADLDKAIELNSNYPIAYYERGSLYFSLGKKEDACQDWKQATALGYGQAYKKLKENCEGIVTIPELREVTTPKKALNPTNSKEYTISGEHKVELRQYEAAILDFNKAIELDPTNGEAYFGRGSAKFALHDNTAACQDWKKALSHGYKQAKEMLKNVCHE
jgi:tetratricopeptide (TPR) repeat protein